MNDLFLLDTNHVSDFIRGRSPALERVMATQLGAGSKVVISSLTHGELLFGFAQKPEAVRIRTAYDKFLLEATILPWTADAAASYAQLRLHLKNCGLVVDTMDLLIASQAHSLGATLVTRDKGFRHIAGLIDVVNWATDLI